VKLTLTKRGLKAARRTVYEFTREDGSKTVPFATRQLALVWAENIKGAEVTDNTGEAAYHNPR